MSSKELVSLDEMDALIASLEAQLDKSTSQRDEISARFHLDRRQLNVRDLLTHSESHVRELKLCLLELREERAKLGMAKEQVNRVRESTQQRGPAPDTAPGTKIGKKFIAPDWIGGRSKGLLVASKEDQTIQTIDMAKRDCFILGRQAGVCHITLEHASVSRQHVALVHGTFQGARGWFIIDLQSAHGTGLKAPDEAEMRRLKADAPKPLVFGSQFKIGKSSRVYKLQPDTRSRASSRKRLAEDRPSDDLDQPTALPLATAAPPRKNDVDHDNAAPRALSPSAPTLCDALQSHSRNVPAVPK